MTSHSEFTKLQSEQIQKWINHYMPIADCMALVHKGEADQSVVLERFFKGFETASNFFVETAALEALKVKQIIDDVDMMANLAEWAIDMKQTEKFNQRLTTVYSTLYELQCFIRLNYTAIVKLLQWYEDKNYAEDRSQFVPIRTEFMQRVHKLPFSEASKQLKSAMTTLEQIAAAQLYQGDVAMAAEHLQDAAQAYTKYDTSHGSAESSRGQGSVNAALLLQKKNGFIIDMDGTVYKDNKLIPGVKEFVEWMLANKKKFVFLTNSSDKAPRDLKEKLRTMGLHVSVDHFWTSAMATASWLSTQKPRGSAYVIGGAGLVGALYDVGYSISEDKPDYVILGETNSYNFEKLQKAVSLVQNGARLIATNKDLWDPSDQGYRIPASGALITPIEAVTGVSSYAIGKPNPLMMRHALRKLGLNRREVAIVGDRMDTDILAGLESDTDTVLVLSGVTRREDLIRYSYKPHFIAGTIADIVKGEGVDIFVSRSYVQHPE